MITEDKITEIFCIADDFCKEFDAELAKNSLQSTSEAPKRRIKRMMSDAESVTIMISASTSILSATSSIIMWNASAVTGDICSRRLSRTTVLWR